MKIYLKKKILEKIQRLLILLEMRDLQKKQKKKVMILLIYQMFLIK